MISYISEIIFFMSNIVGIFIALRLFNCLLSMKKIKPINMKWSLIAILVIATVINTSLETLGISLIVGFVLYFVIGHFFFEGKAHVKLIIAIFLLVFSLITELITVILIGAMLRDQIQNVRENIMFLFLGSIVSKILMMLLIEFIIRFKRRNASRISLSSWMLIITIPITSIVLAIASIYEPVVSGTVSEMGVLSCVVILYINIIVFHLFDSIIVQVDENNKYRFREQQLLYQQDQYENVIAGYNQIKKVRHDMIGHFIAIDGYLTKNMIQEAIEYLGKLSNELNIEKKGILSKNIVVDAIINNRKAKANTLGIAFEHEIAIPELLYVDNMDLCIIIDNALNNAIEACERITDDEQKKMIQLQMKYKKGCALIDIKNTYNPKTIKVSNKKYISSRKERIIGEIGTGIENIESAVEKYGGICHIGCSDMYFNVQIMLPDKKLSL
ncbi:GHKL domain-containing protein [Petrocella sp. FN5]|uniref:GHKL domain-containing protein n=1 Tax=Petrocella sp. FN5 TaxID=3032002 RepID=UPI0023DB5A63|nr:GHKL domain-containing protein [Petrocella sp. FN5]MDF1618201.1 GHKL domain-containing protein [Petrocella sp. FN5]